MPEIYRIKTDGRKLKIETAPFSDETRDLENFIMKNERILGNVALINHQITLPGGKRIDMWGLDTLDLRPVIIELKNVIIGTEVLPQITSYYDYVKRNPDSLKSKALSSNEFKRKLEELEIDLDKISNAFEENPKVILLAPAFKEELLNEVEYIKFDIELVEISRYKTEEQEYLVAIDRPKVTSTEPAKVRVMEDWNWEKYEKKGLSDRKIKLAMKLKERIDNLLKKEGIDFQPIFRKLYIPYQSGNRNIFWFDLSYTSWTTGDVVITFKLEKEPDLKAMGINIEYTKTKWFDNYSQLAIFFNKDVDLEPLIPLIKLSYEYMVGTKT
jgi:hypothetical protein